MKKKSNLSKTVVFMLALTLLALIFIASTYSKYTTTVSGTGTAVIANWNISITDSTSTDPLANDFKINLADTLTSTEENNTFIQPGSKGSFKVKVQNSGDVPAKISAEISDESDSVFTSNQFSLSVSNGVSEGSEVTLNSGESQEVTVNWEWLYDVGGTGSADAADTKLGTEATGTEVKICDIVLKATQVNPNPNP